MNLKEINWAKLDWKWLKEYESDWVTEDEGMESEAVYFGDLKSAQWNKYLILDKANINFVRWKTIRNTKYKKKKNYVVKNQFDWLDKKLNYYKISKLYY